MTGDTHGEPLISQFAGDEDMVEIIEEFVRELPSRAEAIEQLTTLARFDEVRRLAHQLKGAGAGYGFPDLGSAAAELENVVAAAPDDLTGVRRAVDALVELCRRASLG